MNPNMVVAVSPWRARLLLLALAMVGVGCTARTSPPPEAGYERGGIPELRGERVLLLPPQRVEGGHPDLERELVYALETRGPSVTWIGPEAIRRRVASNPGLGLDPDGLPVDRFLAGEIQRVGDPLFGAIYRLAALEDATLAVLPVLARERVEADGSRVVELAVALLHPRSGRVYWYGIVDGAPGAAGDLPATASAVEALARRLLR